MIGELSCWRVDWNAISSVSTAIAALIALAVWIHSMCSANRRKARLIHINQHLMVEELARISAAAVGVWRHSKNPNLEEGIEPIKSHVLALLHPEVANAMVQLAADLPKDLGVAVAKFVSLTGMVRVLVNSLSLASANDGPAAFPADHPLNVVLAQHAEDLVEQANALASELEAVTKLKDGTIRSKVVQVPQNAIDAG